MWAVERNGPFSDAVEGVSFVGLRTDQFSQMVRLFRDVIGMPLAREAVGLAGFRLHDGTVLEVYGPADEHHSFFTTGPVVGLRVGDFDGVRELMVTAGVEFIGAVQHVRGTSWQHFRCPDGTVLEIIGPGTPPPSGPPAPAPDTGTGSDSSAPD
jgi:catechol 2,3-dioxygenase-like lactoylglutathione lyase family enzyme